MPRGREMEETENRAVGVLHGLAAGDRIGGPVRMALCLAESLVDRQGLDVSGIGRRYLEWWGNGAFDTARPPQVLALVDKWLAFEQAAVRVDDRACSMTAGCNPAHRCAPLSMCVWIRDSALAKAALSEAQLTHRHPIAGDVAAAVVRLCRSLIRGTAWGPALSLAAAGRRPETRRAFEASAPLSRSGFAPDALRAAIYCVDSSASFPEALERSIEFAGPANYCPVLVGSIGGARRGSASIASALLDHHGDWASRINAVAASLASAWQRTEG
jgi:ADP-ribosyl-[dinitrogen reductase] hydrolase